MKEKKSITNFFLFRTEKFLASSICNAFPENGVP